MLTILLSNQLTGMQKEEIPEKEYAPAFNADLERSVDHMCIISQGVFNKGFESGRLEMIRNMFFNVHLPIEIIAESAKTTVEEVKKILSEKEAE